MPTTEQIPGGSVTLNAPREAYAIQPRQALTNGPAPEPQLGENQFQFEVNRGAEAGPEARFERLSRGLIPATTPEEKDIRRQFLINAASKHGVPPNELARQMQVEGIAPAAPVEPTAPATPKAPETIETGDGIFQFNPESGRFDIKVGPSKTKAGGAREKLAKLKLTGAEKKETLRETAKLEKAQIISNKAAKALGQAGFFTTGFIGNILSAIPGTPAFNLDKTVDTIKANLGFEELATMRAASPTGGALGQIAVRELEFLQRAMDALELAQSEEQFKDAVTAVKTHYDNVIRNIESGKKAGLQTIGDSEPNQGDDLTEAEKAELAELKKRFK